jgi:hypothetical protein
MMSKIGNNEQGYIEHVVLESNLYPLSMMGSFLSQLVTLIIIKANDYCCVKLWDNTTGNYELLQTWDITKDVPNDDVVSYVKVVVSRGSNRYLAVLAGSYQGNYSYHILLKDIENNGTTIKAVKLPTIFDFRIMDSFSFLADGRTVLFFFVEDGVLMAILLLFGSL